MTKVKHLKQALKTIDASLKVHDSLADHDKLPRYSTGGSREGLPLRQEVDQVNFRELFPAQPGNARVIARRMARTPHRATVEQAWGSQAC